MARIYDILLEGVIDITCLHFLLNGKKELMHDNLLLKIAHLVDSEGIQFVASILKDKLPEELNREEYLW